MAVDRSIAADALQVTGTEVLITLDVSVTREQMRIRCENRRSELHDFHIHQIHLVLLESDGVAVHEPFLRDTVRGSYWTGGAARYPSVTLRMDFRSPSIVGTFLHHCHVLEHEDGGMMGLIRVEPDSQVQGSTANLFRDKTAIPTKEKQQEDK